MNAPTHALELKATLAVLLAACTALLGKLSGLILLWIFVVLLDYITGTAKAVSKGEWSSTVARQGLWHKLGSLFAVAVAALAEIGLSVIAGSAEHIVTRGALTATVLTWYIFTELGSIAENAAEMGAVPKFLIKFIKKVRDAAEQAGDDIAEDDEKEE